MKGGRPRGTQAAAPCLCRGLVAATVLALLVLVPPDAGATPRVTLTPASGLAGSSLSLKGGGFPRGKRIVVKVGRHVLATARSSTRGSFAVSASLPSEAPARTRIITSGGRHRIVNSFAVTRTPHFLEAREVAQPKARLRSKPYRAVAGSPVTLAGKRLPSKRSFRVTFGRVPVASGRTSRRGTFTTRFTVPSLPKGLYSVRARAGRAHLRLIFMITVDPLIAAAGDIACDTAHPAFNGGAGTIDECHMKQTADLVVGLQPAAVLALGDTQYEAGTPPDYRGSYDLTWGRFKSITRAVIGNHEYGHQDGAGYFDYFGPLGGPRPGSYYSFDLGTWHLIALNANCSEVGVTCGPGSPQEQWLRADLAAHPNRCVLAFWHQPLFTSGGEGPEPRVQAFFDALYQAGADLVLTGHNHDYERFAPQSPAGVADPVSGIREFVVGTGGRDLQSLKRNTAPNTEASNDNTFGVLAVTLHPSSYDWRFVPEPGKTFTDSGSHACH
jgi:hypothetical protein